MTNNNHPLTTAQRGYSLLEMIIVLGIIGFIMSGIAVYVNKQLDIRNRQQVANAVVQEISGMLSFVNADQIKWHNNDNPRVIHADINPLYGGDLLRAPNGATPAYINPILEMRYNGHRDTAKVNIEAPTSGNLSSKDNSPFIKRVYYPNNNDYTTIVAQPAMLNVNGVDKAQLPLDWPADRMEFTDSACKTATDAHPVHFVGKYLTCALPVLIASPDNSALYIKRVDFVSNATASESHRITDLTHPGEANTTISRMDVYVNFNPQVPSAHAEIVNYLSALQQALTQKGLSADMFVVRTSGTKATSPANPAPSFPREQPHIQAYTPIVIPGTPDHALTLADAINHTNLLHPTAGTEQRLAIRLVFRFSGRALHAEGDVLAEKLCWSSATGAPAPCLKSSDDGSALMLTNRQGNEMATLQAKDVVLQRNDGQGGIEYYTAPHIQYRAFKNPIDNPGQGGLPPCDPGGGGQPASCKFLDGTEDNTHLDPSIAEMSHIEYGAIRIPVQSCPTYQPPNAPPGAPPIKLFPKLITAISSVAAATPTDINPNTPDYEFPRNDQASNNSIIGNFALSRVDVARSHRRDDGSTDPAGANPWVLSAKVSASSTVDNRGRIYYNPTWLSLQITTWCSTDTKFQVEKIPGTNPVRYQFFVGFVDNP